MLSPQAAPTPPVLRWDTGRSGGVGATRRFPAQLRGGAWDKIPEKCYGAKMMIILLLACASGVESGASEINLPPIPKMVVTEGDCGIYPDFEVDPAATIIAVVCEDQGTDTPPLCRFQDYRIAPGTNHIKFEGCGDHLDSWKVTQIIQGA